MHFTHILFLLLLSLNMGHCNNTENILKENAVFTTTPVETMQDKYDLRFQNYTPCGWDWLQKMVNSKGHYDSINTEAGSGCLPLTISYTNNSFANTSFIYMDREVVLPENKYEKIKISFTAKNLCDSNLVFTVLAINNEETMIGEKTNVISKGNNWQTSQIDFDAKDVKLLHFIITYSGKINTSQKILLQGIDIKLDNADFNMMPSKQNVAYASLQKQHIMKAGAHSGFSRLDSVLRNKKIIGLAENTHGSKTVRKSQIDYLKHLVQQRHCKLILSETPVDLGLLIDAYIQGVLPYSATAYKDYIKISFAHKEQIEFIEWLREYNRTQIEKVHLLGMDNPIKAKYILIDFYLALLGEKDALPYIKALNKNDWQGVAEIKNKLVAEKIVGKNYTHYKYVLESLLLKNSDSERDSMMYVRTKFFDSLFTTSNQQIAIISHIGHLQKNTRFDGTINKYNYTLGSLLNAHYSDKFYSIGYCFGEGEFTNDTCHISGGSIVKENLRKVPENSFEYVAAKSESDNFFYETKYLPAGINTIADIGRASQLKNHFYYANLQKRFDALYFIKQSEAAENAEGSTIVYLLRLGKSKQAEVDKILSKY